MSLASPICQLFISGLVLLLCFAIPIRGICAFDVLTAEERAYLDQHGPVVFISQSNYPPFEFRERNGMQDGMTIELAHWLATELGFRARFSDTSFHRAQQAILSGEADVLTSFFYSEKRDETFDFTQTLFEVPASIFVPVERPDIVEMEDLEGKRIAIQQGDYAKNFLEEHGIEFRMIPTRDFAEATDAVIEGHADAIIGDEQIVLYHLFNQGLRGKVKKVGEPLYIGRNCMAVKEGNRILLSIIDKGLEHARVTGVFERLTRKWVGTRYTATTDYLTLWPYLAVIAGLVLVVVAWNLQLRRVVKKKTRALAASEQRLQYAFEGANDGLWDWNMRTGEVFFSPRWLTMLGYEPGEIEPRYESWVNLLHPDDRGQAVRQAEHLQRHPDEELALTFRLRNKNGTWHCILSRGKVMERDADGRAQRAVGTHQDITRQKLIEDELRQSEERYRLVVDNLKEVVFQTDAEGLWTFLNPAWQEITGFPVAESIGRLFLDYIHPDDRERNLALFRPLIERQKEFCRHEIRYLTSDGGFRWIEVFARLTLDEKGRILGTSGTLTDVTERKEAETALRESENRFQRMFRDHDAIMLLIEPATGEIIDANNAACEFYGYTLEEFRQLGMDRINALPATQAVLAREQALKGERNQFEFPHRLASGEIRTVQIHSSPIKVQGRSLLFSIIRDITQRKQAEQRLQLQAAALDAAANAILITDQEGIIKWANPAFSRLSGYAVEEILGHNPKDLVRSGHQSKAFYDRLWQTILSGQPWQGELVNRRKDGSTYEEELTITPVLSSAGEIQHFIAVKQDISDRKRLEREQEQVREQLFHSQKLDSLGRLAGGIAHDLNNLLVPIIGCSDMAIQKLDDQGHPLLTLLQQIQKAGLRASALINQVLAFGRQQQLNRQPLDPNRAVLALQNLVNSLLASNIELDFELQENLPYILADAGKLEQALINLCINARDAMPEGGTLSISTCRQPRPEQPAGQDGRDQICITITDTGHGIDPVTREKILDPFFTTKPKGTGLGLSMVLGIVEQHGGSLFIDSELGRGASFSLCFPVADAIAPETAPLKQGQVPPTGRETILVVDDEEQVRQTATEILRSGGFRVLEASSGDLAVRVVQNPPFPIDLVLTDLTMPQISGYELAKILIRTGFDRPVIFMSGYAQVGLEEAHGINPDIFLQKPFQPHDLLKFVRSCLDRQISAD